MQRYFFLRYIHTLIITLTATCSAIAAQPKVVRTDSIVADSVKGHTVNPGEVVITARVGGTMTASSVIGRDAISHIQPSSIADLLELLPGGQAKDPQLATPQTIRLREADPIASYATSSLGTQFLVDGVPISNDMNLQSSPVSSSYGSSFTSEGVDMRTVSTDNVERVEIVRGIPSAEYGDLTSGLVKMRRKQGGNDFNARFKADMSSKLFSAGKGFEWDSDDKGALTLNADLSYLDARSDPRRTRQNYKRMTGSIRVRKQWLDLPRMTYTLGAALDYTGSMDDEKSDRDLNTVAGVPVESYRSSYDRFSGSVNLRMANKRTSQIFRSIDAVISVTAEKDRIRRNKIVEPGIDSPICIATEPGEHDAAIVPFNYESGMTVEGRPIYVYANAVANLGYITPSGIDLGFKAGVNWNMSKNEGRGTVFDITRPFSLDMNVRPRIYKDIPALQQLHLFVESNSMVSLGDYMLKWMAGVRAMTMPGLSRDYALHGEWKLDPRLNLRLELPSFTAAGSTMRIGVAGGVGWHTKFPTAEQLYPDMIWYDITQLNYWPSDPEMRRVNMAVFRVDPTNFNLDAARNRKAEVTLDLSWHDCMLSVTLFHEDMRSGFRSSSVPTRYIYKNYDESVIDPATLGGKRPDLATLPFVNDTLLTTHSFTTNGSRTLKRGVEFTIVSPRVKPLATRFSISGAWFHTTYQNSQPEYYRPSVTIGGKAYPYIGYYEDTDDYLRERFNTNLSTDTQLPRLGLVFSTSFQCTWFTGSKSNWRDPMPLEYVDKNMERHPFTDASAQDGVLQQLIRSYNKLSYAYTRIPFQMNINLKVQKKLYHDRITLALFANKLLDISPSYTSALGVRVRREVNPYFGMELSLKL